MNATAIREGAQESNQIALAHSEQGVFLQRVTRIDGVAVEARPGAAACGASGCRSSRDLVHVHIAEWGSRVLCIGHARDVLQREGRE